MLPQPLRSLAARLPLASSYCLTAPAAASHSLTSAARAVSLSPFLGRFHFTSSSSSDSGYSALFHKDRVSLISSSPRPSTTLTYKYHRFDSPSQFLEFADADAGVIFLSSDQAGKRNNGEMIKEFGLEAAIPAAAWEEFEGKARQSICVYPSSVSGPKRIFLVGLGPEADLSVQAIRVATHTAVKTLKKRKAKNAAVLIPSSTAALSASDLVDSVTRIATLSNHQFSKYLTKPSHTIESFHLFSNSIPADVAESAIAAAQPVVESTVLARELANDRGDVVTPEFMEKVAKLISDTHALGFQVLQEDELKKRGLNLICAVGQGAKEKARIVSLEYRSAEAAETIALVGKGITFDTGGLNLKPTNSIETMYLDMHGSASVLAAMKAIAIIKPKINVICVLALAENAIDQLSIKPHSIIQTPKGSVQIQNTDAEGRLALADAFTFVQTQFPNAKTIVDLATLTGACVVALGEYQAGLFSNSDRLAGEIQESGSRVYERVWRMPILSEHTDELNSSQSDFKSTGTRFGGACSAAAFLQKFINSGVEWSHLDIAGPAMYSKSRDWMPEGGTGFGAQLLVDFVLKRAAADNKTAK